MISLGKGYKAVRPDHGIGYTVIDPEGRVVSFPMSIEAARLDAREDARKNPK